MGKGTTSLSSRRCRHGLEIKRLSGSGHFLFSFARLCRYGGRFSAKTHFGAFYGLSTVVFSVKLRIFRGPHSENNGFMLSEAVSQHGGKKLIPYAHFPRSAVARCGVKMRGVSVAIRKMKAQRLSLFAFGLCAMMWARFCEQGFIDSLTMRFRIWLIGLRLIRLRPGFAECLSPRKTRSGEKLR